MPRVHSLSALALVALTGCASAPPTASDPGPSPPNVVLIFADDLGYADLSCFGATGHATPNLDGLAGQGMRFTDFCVAQAVCSASRAALLTGCYSNRVSILGALGPQANHGIHPDEEILPELLREQGYATGAVGKWHLGHRAPFLPTHHGFDEYLGLPYSNDMWPVDYDGSPVDPETHPRPWKANHPPLPLIEGTEVVVSIRTLDDQDTLTRRYTERAVDFIERRADGPFFLYLAHSMPHVPLGNAARFDGVSDTPFGDVVTEIDWSVGEVLDALERTGAADHTIVIFTSDNGPWLNYGDHAGSTGPLREGKGTSWEGGIRVPFIVRWPGVVPAGIECGELAATIDMLPTIAHACGARLPERVIDGVDVGALWRGEVGATPRTEYVTWYGKQLQAVRRGTWKLQLPHEYRSYAGVEPGRDGYPGPTGTGTTGTALYDLRRDVGETTDVAAAHPEIVRDLESLAERWRDELGDAGRDGRGIRAPGRVAAEAEE